MQTTLSRTLALLVSAALVLALGASSLLAQETVKVSGKWTATMVKQDTTNVGDTEGHFFSVTRSIATNMSTDETKFLDAASVVNEGIADLIQGSGSQKGYVTLAKGGNLASCSYEGSVTTVEGKEGPMISFEGTFTYTNGTGQYAGIKGIGTYRGHYTSKTTYDVEWSAEYSIVK